MENESSEEKTKQDILKTAAQKVLDLQSDAELKRGKHNNNILKFYAGRYNLEPAELYEYIKKTKEEQHEKQKNKEEQEKYHYVIRDIVGQYYINDVTGKPNDVDAIIKDAAVRFGVADLEILAKHIKPMVAQYEKSKVNGKADEVDYTTSRFIIAAENLQMDVRIEKAIKQDKAEVEKRKAEAQRIEDEEKAERKKRWQKVEEQLKEWGLEGRFNSLIGFDNDLYFFSGITHGSPEWNELKRKEAILFGILRGNKEEKPKADDPYKNARRTATLAYNRKAMMRNVDAALGRSWEIKPNNDAEIPEKC